MAAARFFSALRTWAWGILVLGLLLGAPANAGRFEALFAPKADLWERWTERNPADSRMLDHGAWDKFLKRYVSPDADGVNRLAYAQVAQGDQQRLANYLQALAATPISSYNAREQLAYWINLYNALTVKVVLDHYPVESIRDIDISPGLFSTGPWDKKLIAVEGEALTLNDIEHRILRPIWRDARIHYAVNCASLGCPNLPVAAFTGSNANALLEEAARNYVNHPRGARIEAGGLVVSSIYLWFQEDFGGSDQGVISHLQRYAGPGLKAELMDFDKIDDDQYDWALNDAR